MYDSIMYVYSVSASFDNCLEENNQNQDAMFS